MFNENHNIQEQETGLSENFSGNTEPEINDAEKNAGDEKGMEASERQNEIKEETEAPGDENAAIDNARTRALAQVERLSRDNGFSGPWGNLFRTYPSLSRNDAYRQLGKDVKDGMTPLEAYQRKLLEEKEHELERMRSVNHGTNRSIGVAAEEDNEQQLDDFLVGFYSV